MTNENDVLVAYADALPAVRELIARTLRQSDPCLAEVMDHLTRENGKNLRAALLLAAAADGSARVGQDAIIAAAALETLHLATLVHDDIIDEAPTRRGQPSVQSRFGKKTAVLGGDYLFCVCFTMVAGISARYPDKLIDFSRGMTRICVGELRQYQHNGDTELSPMAYLRTIAGKTAALFALALYAGSILGGCSESEARLAGRIGYYIGMHFQLADDCMDYEAASETLRKSTKHDLGEGVITLPLILAFAADPGLKEIVRNRELSESEVISITAEVARLGGIVGSWRVADRYYRKATGLLDRISDPAKRERLAAILKTIQNRQQ
jgi:heptaprenyl diphosphate synthase